MSDTTMNRRANSHNQYQGDYKKVLCVCSAGLLRSPTTALVLSQAPYHFNTRAAGINPEYALVPVDEVLLEWADEIVCMERKQAVLLEKLTNKPVLCLEIPDHFRYRDTELMDMVKKQYDKMSKPVLTNDVKN